MPETLAVGSRAGFYEKTGAYRDMVVTHLMQILAFVAMEPPTALAPEPITEEKNKVFRSLRPLDPDAGRARPVRGLHATNRVSLRTPAPRPSSPCAARSTTGAGAGCPFYLRTGKRMGEGARIISIAFREPPQSMFPEHSRVGRYGPDHLTFDLDESSRVSLSFYGKRPGMGMVLDKASMQFSLDETDYRGDTLEAYERLIRDAMDGDHTLFTTAKDIERLWEVSTPLLEYAAGGETVPAGLLGPGRDRRSDRAAQLAPAIRPALARRGCHGQGGRPARCLMTGPGQRPC